MQSENLKYSDEIDLMENIRTLQKSRYVLLGFVVVGIVLAIGVNYLPQKYKGEVIIEVGSINGGMIEPAVQTAEKINAGFYGNDPSLFAENIQATNLVRISTISSDKEEIRKMLELAVKNVLSEQNKAIEIKKALAQEKVDKIKKLMSYWLSAGQQIMPLQVEILSIENTTSAFIPSMLIGQVEIVSKRIGLKMSLIFGFLLGLILGSFLILIRKWWRANLIRI